MGSSSWWKETDENAPLLEIPTGSVLVADSIIKDFCNGLLGCNMGDAMPGLFFVPGEKTQKQILHEHLADLVLAEAHQNHWFDTIIGLASSTWAKIQNPLAIPDDARFAARARGREDLPWLGEFRVQQMIPCIACGSLRDPRFPICPSCRRVVDKELYAKLNVEESKEQKAS